MKIFIEFIRVLVDYYLEKPLVVEPQMCDETKTFIWKLVITKQNGALLALAQNYETFRWVEKHPGHLWFKLPKGI
jgi:hypothetical protein